MPFKNTRAIYFVGYIVFLIAIYEQFIKETENEFNILFDSVI